MRRRNTARGSHLGSSSCPPQERRRKDQKSGRPHDWRTRPDPFEGLWEQITAWLTSNPERTGVSLFQELQACYPGRFPDVQLRTLQRGLLTVRQGLLLTFEDHWGPSEPINGHAVAPELRAVALAPSRSQHVGGGRKPRIAAVSFLPLQPSPSYRARGVGALRCDQGGQPLDPR